MRKSALIAGFIAIAGFTTPVLALGDVELGISYCVDDERTKPYTNGCGVQTEKGEVFFSWREYIAYKYQHMELKDIRVNHIERDWHHDEFMIVIHYHRKRSWGNKANEPKNACRNIVYGCPVAESKEY